MAKVTIAQQERTSFREVEVGQIFKAVASAYVYLKIKEERPDNVYNLQSKKVASVAPDATVQVYRNSEIIVA